MTKGPPLKKTIFLAACIVFSLFSSAVALCEEDLPRLKDVPDYFSDAPKKEFTNRKQIIESQLNEFQIRADSFNVKEADIQTSEEFSRLLSMREKYVNTANAFNRDIDAAVETEFFGRRYRAPVLVVDAIKGMNALAKKIGWPAEEQDRLDDALNKLHGDGDDYATGTQIRETWANVLARGEDGVLAEESAKGEGPDLSGAGTQASFNDCTIFALATAAGLPYGAVAARATLLISQGDWSDPVERDHPEKTIEKWGLIGHEVVMLAEAFGRAEIVASSDFAKVLKERRPVLIDVVPEDGNTSNGHEVVLTKTFQHNGETWYAMMDSNQGPVRRLYLSKRELDVMLQENGVAFHPDPRATPGLLRKKSDS